MSAVSDSPATPTVLERVTCIVESVFPFGVFVRLSDGSRGYIRRRELTLSGDVEPAQAVCEGQRIEAVVLSRTGGKTPELSVKAALPDPWSDFLRSHRVGDVVPVTVKRLFADGALVEIVPGVDGYVPLRELSAQDGASQAEDIVWPGDQSEAVIIHVDAADRRVLLSIRQWAHRIGAAETFLSALQKEEPTGSDQTPTNTSPVLRDPTSTPLNLPNPVLVVEDQEELRRSLVEWLLSLGCSAVGVCCGDEALQRCQGQPFSLALIDLDMPKVDGLSLLQELRRQGHGMAVAVMSGPELLSQHLSQLRALEVAAVFPKPLHQDEIYRFLRQLADGQPITLTDLPPEPTHQGVQDFQTLAGLLRSPQATSERLQEGLQRLVTDLRAHFGALFQVNLASRTVSVVAQAGALRLHSADLYGLIDSPVKDVVVEGGVLWENHVTAVQHRYRKLRDLFAFESCIGIPLEVSGRVEHALFLFGREPGAFSPYRLRDALAAATLFSAVLHGQELERRAQAVGAVLLSGQLASAFSHEVYNKITALDLQVTNARHRLRTGYAESALEESISSAREAIEQIAQTAAALKRTVEDFQRLARHSSVTSVDVNKAILAAKALVDPLALRQKTRVVLELAPNLPRCMGSSVRLQHVFLNLMLNAVQQMAHQPETKRVVRVVTSAASSNGREVVQARFSDTGPGIHRKLWEKIFSMGFTTRQEGSGLGLFISRSLVQSMGGRLVVESSLMQLGTTFLVELPAAAWPLPEPGGLG
ncbi:MAG: S1 RNA-binding domain-containing protein [Caldilineales bacterium]|nr:S1 RNA-binding domain-containing protein [Caldilineales bacterium]MDW8316856.1 S1 RNA-binding domain-containing protein [Anaerolineae bacterium]